MLYVLDLCAMTDRVTSTIKLARRGEIKVDLQTKFHHKAVMWNPTEQK